MSKLIENGCYINAHDPKGVNEAKALLPNSIKYFDDVYVTMENADAVVLMTEWDVYCNLDMEVVKQKLNMPIFIDLRNIYEPEKMNLLGFEYSCIGR